LIRNAELEVSDDQIAIALTVKDYTRSLGRTTSEVQFEAFQKRLGQRLRKGVEVNLFLEVEILSWVKYFE